MPRLQEFYTASEAYLSTLLQQARILSNHSHVKGDAIEDFVKELLQDHMPMGCKVHHSGHIVWGEDADNPGTLYDLIIYKPDICGPLSKIGSHSIFPLECVVGAIEITSYLKECKMEEDIKKLTKLRLMNRRFYWLSTGYRTHVPVYEEVEITPRCFLFAADSEWKKVETCAKHLQEALVKTSKEEAHLHGLYVRDLGFFDVEPRLNRHSHYFTIRHKEKNPLLTFINNVTVSIHRFPTRPDIKRIYFENKEDEEKYKCSNFSSDMLYPRLEKYHMGDTELQVVCQGISLYDSTS